MNERKLIVDDDKQTSMSAKIKYFGDRLFTYIIEILEDKTIDEMLESGDVEKIIECMQFPDTSFKPHPIYKDRTIIEHSDSLKVVNDYYTSNPSKNNYGDVLCKKIWIAQKDNEDFPGENKFRNDYKKQCEKERDLLKEIRENRNKNRAHDVMAPDMIMNGIWITNVIEYIQVFKTYRIDELGEYDPFFRSEKFMKLEEYYVEANKLRNLCFDSSGDSSEFEFCNGRRYIVNLDNPEEDNIYELKRLIQDMAINWERGIDYLRLRSERFEEFLKIVINDTDKLIDYEKLQRKLQQTTENSIEESMIYMSILYFVCPEGLDLYWKGKRRSEYAFASKVLQILTRHPGAYKLHEKISSLRKRIVESETWNSEGRRKGWGINIVTLCERKILSKYFNGKNDNKGRDLANKFENSIKLFISAKSEAEEKKIYDSVMTSILELTAYMKGKTSYILPISNEDLQTKKYVKDYNNDESTETNQEEVNETLEINVKPFRTFNESEEFRQFFIEYFNSGISLEAARVFVRIVNSDMNFNWWMDKCDMYKEVEE